MTTNLDTNKSPNDPSSGNHHVRRHGGTQSTAAEARIVVSRTPRIPAIGPRPVSEAGPTLFVRVDRIGDLVLSLPADNQFEELEGDGEREVDWWISEGLGFIADHAVPRRRVREMKSKISFQDFKIILREVKARKYQTAVVLHAPWWMTILLWLARIPNRLGPRSQWHSFLFLNQGVRQKRSLAEASEFEYNMRVMDVLTSRPAIKRTPLKLKVDPEWKTQTLKANALTNRKYSVVHPGMRGSARNWPTSHYISWIQEASKNETVVITGTAADEPMLEPIRQALEGARGLVWLNGKLSGPQLLHVLDGARCVLAPSTGVAHLAASLGRPVIGLYSPVKVQHPTRWAPQGESVQVLVPEVDCPAKKTCTGQACPHYDCMNRISLESVRSLWSASS